MWDSNPARLLGRYIESVVAIWQVRKHQPFLATVEMVHILGTRSPYSPHMATPLPALAASEGAIDKMKWGEINIKTEKEMRTQGG